MAMIGVVVPVYKVEPYLSRCVESILRQTFSDFELILVDDGSPDRCGELCEEYARRDSRIRVIHQQNAGLSMARNSAIDLLLQENSVQWLTFIDSDDWVHPKMLECLITAVQQHDTKIASCGFEETTGADPEVSEEELTCRCMSARDFYLGHYVNATIACAKLYHISCFERMRYPAGKLHEDEFVTYRLLFAAENVSVTFAPLYAYYINMAGITKSPWVSRRMDALDAFDQQLAWFKTMGDADLIRFRARGYLETALKHYAAAEEAGAAGDLKQLRRRIRWLIRECWSLGIITFWPDFDFLIRFYPYYTRIYRLWLEIKNR
jgi:glycosyltransferase involved in cell wall biosynthesis